MWLFSVYILCVFHLRKKGMLLNTGFGILAALLMGLSKLAGSYEMVIIGRFFVGFNCGETLFIFYMAQIQWNSLFFHFIELEGNIKDGDVDSVK